MKILTYKDSPCVAPIVDHVDFVAPEGYEIVALSAAQEIEYLGGKKYWTPAGFNGQLEGSLSIVPIEVPRSIPNWRARAVIELNGLTAQVEQAIEAMTGPEGVVARFAWNGNADFERNGTTVTALANALGLSDAQIDNMFIQAAQLTI